MEYTKNDTEREQMKNASLKIKNMLKLERGVKSEHPTGIIMWKLPNSNKIHRDYGPAIEHPSGMKEYYNQGNRHRLDGPAIENPQRGESQYWIDGEKYSNQFEFERALKGLKK